MIDFFRPISNIGNNKNIYFSPFGKISSRLVDFGQCRYVVNPYKGQSLEGILVYSDENGNKISLTEKKFKVLAIVGILTGAVTFSPFLLLIPTIILAVKAIFNFSNSFISFDNLLNEWINNREARGEKIGAASRIKKAFINHSNDLNLRGLGLTELPSCIGLLSNLKNLDLSYNKLTSLTPLSQLSKLTRLVLSNNDLQTWPKEIFHLSNLNRLDLYNNNLISLPKEIGQLYRS